MKVGVISDIHSNIVALEAVLRALEEENVEKILCAGDLVGYYPFPEKTVSRIRDVEALCVLGNHDFGIVTETPREFNRMAKRALDWNRRNLSEENLVYLEDLPETRRLIVDDLDVFMAHGSPTHPVDEYVWEEDVNEGFLDLSFETIPDVLILGHTHRSYVKVVGETMCLNPGSVGQPRDGDSRASFGVIDTETYEIELHRMEYEIDWVAEETEEYLPRQLAERLYEGR
jgi:putative phosphoesterase